jgi:hypothetical protein
MEGKPLLRATEQDDYTDHNRKIREQFSGNANYSHRSYPDYFRQASNPTSQTQATQRSNVSAHLPEVSGQRTKSCATIVAVWATTLPSAIGLPHIPKGRAEVTRTETETEIRAMTVAAVVTAEAAIHRIREKPKEE